MDARDLRIGDKVLFKKEICVIDEIENGFAHIWKNATTSILVKLLELSPIPVTVELLEKLGFKENKYKYLLNTKYDLELGGGFIQIPKLSNNIGKDWYVYIDNLDHEMVGGMAFQYLHELQHIIWDCLHVELNTEKL